MNIQNIQNAQIAKSENLWDEYYNTLAGTPFGAYTYEERLAMLDRDYPDLTDEDEMDLEYADRRATGRTIAYIHEAPTGRYYVSGDESGGLDESGSGYITRADALRAAHLCGYTHVRGQWYPDNGLGMRIPKRYRTSA